MAIVLSASHCPKISLVLSPSQVSSAGFGTAASLLSARSAGSWAIVAVPARWMVCVAAVFSLVIRLVPAATHGLLLDLLPRLLQPLLRLLWLLLTSPSPIHLVLPTLLPRLIWRCLTWSTSQPSLRSTLMLLAWLRMLLGMRRLFRLLCSSLLRALLVAVTNVGAVLFPPTPSPSLLIWTSLLRRGRLTDSLRPFARCGRTSSPRRKSVPGSFVLGSLLPRRIHLPLLFSSLLLLLLLRFLHLYLRQPLTRLLSLLMVPLLIQCGPPLRLVCVTCLLMPSALQSWKTRAMSCEGRFDFGPHTKEILVAMATCFEVFRIIYYLTASGVSRSLQFSLMQTILYFLMSPLPFLCLDRPLG